MTRAIIDQRDALRRTVARQDDEIRRLQTENRRLRSGLQDYKDDLGQHMRKVLKECPIA